MTEFQYMIGGRKYTQAPLVLGQVQQLIALLRDEKTRIPANLAPWSVMELLGDKLSEGIAIVLTEDAKHLKDKDLDALATEIRFSIRPADLFKVVEDFFDCNPIASDIKDIGEAIKRISEKIPPGSPMPSSPSATETSAKETRSSGDSPQENANLSLDTV
jgi:hypothetical protein